MNGPPCWETQEGKTGPPWFRGGLRPVVDVEDSLLAELPTENSPSTKPSVEGESGEEREGC